MHSADHYSKQQKCTKTELAQVLKSAGDTVMTVMFRKKLQLEQLALKLSHTNKAEELAQGEACVLVCHLVKCEQSLGRSTVISLNAEGN